MGYSGAGGKLIHKKTRSKKSCDTVPLILQCSVCISFIFCYLDTSIALLAKQNQIIILKVGFFVTGKNELENFSNERAQLTFPLNYMLDLFTVR
jgi:hypothetical protein